MMIGSEPTMGEQTARTSSEITTDQAPRRYARNARIGIALGSVTFLGSYLLVIFGCIPSAWVPAVLSGSWALALALVVWGSSCLAKQKGYHCLLGVLGVLPCLLGVGILVVLPDRRAGQRWSAVGALGLVLFSGLSLLGIVVIHIGVIHVVSMRQEACENAAFSCVGKLRTALEKLRAEESDRDCPGNGITTEQLGYLVGPHYGWNGTNRKCGVLVRISGNEIHCCSLKGFQPNGHGSRYLYRLELSSLQDLPQTIGQCSGSEYGGPDALCHTEGMLKPDCSVRRPAAMPCGEHR